MNDWDGILCSECNKPFTAKSWDKRHTNPRDRESDCHAECCPRCRLIVAQEKRDAKAATVTA